MAFIADCTERFIVCSKLAPTSITGIIAGRSPLTIMIKREAGTEGTHTLRPIGISFTAIIVASNDLLQSLGSVVEAFENVVKAKIAAAKITANFILFVVPDFETLRRRRYAHMLLEPLYALLCPDGFQLSHESYVDLKALQRHHPIRSLQTSWSCELWEQRHHPHTH